MFADIVLLTKLETFAFPLTTITEADNAGGNTGAVGEKGDQGATGAEGQQGGHPAA